MEPPPQDAQSAFPPAKGLALASLALGIAAVGLSFLLVGLLVGLVGVGLGIAYLSKKRGPPTMARWGVGLSLLGSVASLGFGLLYFHYYHLLTSGQVGSFNVTTTGALANPPPLPASSPLLNSNLLWSTTVSGAQALCVGDWESDGSARVLVAAGQTLHVLDLTGAEKSTLALPDQFATMECGRNKAGGARLLGYKTWGQQVLVIDHTGKQLWSQSGGMGVNGAHWGDLDGSGNDAMMVGKNGFGGLEAVSGDGKKLWSASMANVWSQAIVPATSNSPALVLATDASGAVNVFDAVGHRQNSLRPEGGYFAAMTAGVIESNVVQILACSGNAVVAFDHIGKVAWMTAAQSSMASRGSPREFAARGDLKGDGTQQWVFMDGGGDLVIATAGGLKVSSIPNQSRIQGFAIAPRPGQGALLLTLDGGVVRAYSFQP
jgi:outer membrane protein assembly factor BamB